MVCAIQPWRDERSSGSSTAASMVIAQCPFMHCAVRLSAIFGSQSSVRNWPGVAVDRARRATRPYGQSPLTVRSVGKVMRHASVPLADYVGTVIQLAHELKADPSIKAKCALASAAPNHTSGGKLRTVDAFLG